MAHRIMKTDVTVARLVTKPGANVLMWLPDFIWKSPNLKVTAPDVCVLCCFQQTEYQTGLLQQCLMFYTLFWHRFLLNHIETQEVEDGRIQVSLFFLLSYHSCWYDDWMKVCFSKSMSKTFITNRSLTQRETNQWKKTASIIHLNIVNIFFLILSCCGNLSLL